MESTLSERKKDQLYRSISDDIADARIKIWKMKDQRNISIAEIDFILYELSVKAPKNAIDLFDKTKKPKP